MPKGNMNKSLKGSRKVRDEKTVPRVELDIMDMLETKSFSRKLLSRKTLLPPGFSAIGETKPQGK